MIRVERGAEPAELAAARALRLPRAQVIWDAEKRVTKALKKLLTGYDPDNRVKRALYTRQHRKCAYCERSPGFGNQPVEHFRPKNGAWRHRRGQHEDVDLDRYWWLTWSWANLFFACTTCNGPASKGNRFPLVPGSAPLAIGATDTSPEQPLLLDPARSDFDVRAHLGWRPVERTAHRRLWRWQLETLTPAGERTAEVLGLAKLADDLAEHYRSTVWPRFEAEVDKPCQQGAPAAELMSQWDRLCRDLIKREARWTAGTWFMLDALRTSTPQLVARRLPPPRWPDEARVAGR